MFLNLKFKEIYPYNYRRIFAYVIDYIFTH